MFLYLTLTINKVALGAGVGVRRLSVTPGGGPGVGLHVPAWPVTRQPLLAEMLISL